MLFVPLGYLLGPAGLSLLPARALDVDRSLNRIDMTSGVRLWFEDRGTKISREKIGTFPRIGVGYAGVWAKKPYRFRIAGC